MFVRRQAIEEVGGMDERNEGAYSEDKDWCCRMWQREWRVTYFPDAQAIHEHMREGMKKPWGKAARYQLISAIRMFQKFGWKLSRTPHTENSATQHGIAKKV